MMAVSALLMVGIRTPFHAGRQEEIGGRMDGYRQLMADRWMRRLTLAWALIMVGVGPVIVAEVVLAHHFGVGSLGYGLISVFWDGGGVAGAILGVRLVRRFEQAAVVGGSGAIAAGFAIVGLTPIFWPVLLGMMVAGVFDSFGTVAAQNMLQRRTPDRLRSRVSAALDAVVLGAMGASFALGAPLVTWLGAQGVYLAASALTVVATLMLVPALRHMPEPVVIPVRQPRPVQIGRPGRELRRERMRRPALRRPRLPRRPRRTRERRLVARLGLLVAHAGAEDELQLLVLRVCGLGHKADRVHQLRLLQVVPEQVVLERDHPQLRVVDEPAEAARRVQVVQGLEDVLAPAGVVDLLQDRRVQADDRAPAVVGKRHERRTRVEQDPVLRPVGAGVELDAVAVQDPRHLLDQPLHRPPGS